MAKNKTKREIIKRSEKKTIMFLAGALIAGASLLYFKQFPLLAFISLMIGAVLMIRAIN